jgi:Baseplate J-like protein
MSETVTLSPQTGHPTVPLPPDVVEGEIVVVADDYQPPSPPPPHGGWRVPALLGALALVSLALGVTMGRVVSPLLFASATVTLTAETHTLTAMTAIALTVRLFPAGHESLSRTVASTGIATRPARAAQGVITFYNGLPQPQTIAAGTLLTSASGVPVLTEQNAYIPAASPPTEGATTVSARAENTGPAGNIAAGTIGGPCCRAYVLAYNGAFGGGADARTYRTPTPTDISNALAPLRSQVDRQMQGAIRTWLQPREVLLPPKCHATSSTSAKPGAEADHVTVTAAETCTAAAYNEGELQQAATARLGTLASHQFGPAYRLVSDAHPEITGSTVTNDHATFQLRVSGLYSYSFSQPQLVRLRAQLLGVSRDRARVILNHLVGVTQAQIQSSYATLPSDPSRIHILLAQ